MVLPINTLSNRPGGAPPAPRGWPILRLGFRPFYLGAAAFGAIAVPLWIAVYTGGLAIPTAVAPLLWHAHEMLFGFAAAVIIGFLLTASRAWTGRETPRGPALGVLASVWLVARVAAVTGPYPLYAIADVALLPLVAIVLFDVLLRAGNHRNLPIAGLVTLLALANVSFHLAVAQVVPLDPIVPLHAALALIVGIESVMGGRVIPAFTGNAIPGLGIRIRPRFERATLALTAVALVAWVAAPASPYTALPLALAAIAHFHRQSQWKPWATRARPILWILHAAYVWVPIGFALLAYEALTGASGSSGVHALAVGATGGLVIGMITRTARGHTGRKLEASRAEVVAYALVMAAAGLRVLLPLVMPLATRNGLLVAAAIAWSAAFVIYLVVYVPWLASTRLDSKDG